MYLVNDVHPLLHLRGGKHRFLPQGTHIVHAVVGGGVQLHHVHHRALGNAPAGGAFAAGVALHRVFAVDSLGQDAGAGSLAGAPGADEDIGMGEPPGLHLVFQGLGNMLLPHHIIKGLGPPLAIQSLIHGAPPGS